MAGSAKAVTIPSPNPRAGRRAGLNHRARQAPSPTSTVTAAPAAATSSRSAAVRRICGASSER